MATDPVLPVYSGMVLEVICDEGFANQGDSTVTCLEDGTYSYSVIEPACKRKFNDTNNIIRALARAPVATSDLLICNFFLKGRPEMSKFTNWPGNHYINCEIVRRYIGR